MSVTPIHRHVWWHLAEVPCIHAGALGDRTRAGEHLPTAVEVRGPQEHVVVLRGHGIGWAYPDVLGHSAHLQQRHAVLRSEPERRSARHFVNFRLAAERIVTPSPRATAPLGYQRDLDADLLGA